MEYRAIIEKHKDDFINADQLGDFLDLYLDKSRNITDLDDYINEYADDDNIIDISSFKTELTSDYELLLTLIK